jgi:hypothetical protein
MSTSKSPIKKLRAEARRMARLLKRAERGKPARGFENARDKDPFKFAIAMDDKVLTIEMPWSKVAETSEAGLVEFIVNHMRGESPVLQ